MRSVLELPTHDDATAPPSPDDGRALVLVVDDSADKRCAMRAMLSAEDYEVVEAGSGLAALRCVLAQQFAVILLDVRMPIMDGFETAARIREREQSELTPIIFITANQDDEIPLEERYTDGAVDFMFAPVPAAELRAKVAVFANQFRRAARLAAQANEVQTYAEQLVLVTEAAPIGIFQTDADNRYVYTNPHWSDITDISAADAIGETWDTFVSPAGRAAFEAELPHGLSDLRELRHRFSIPVAGSEPRIVLVHSKVIPGRDGAGIGWVGTLADITAEVGAEAAMKEARDAALAANQMQEMFATSASHELRTPTTVILGFAEELLESTTMSEQDHHFVSLMYRNAQRLSELIDDLLIVGQAEVGASMMHVGPTPIEPLVERVVAGFAEAAHRSCVGVVASYDPDLPAADVDPLRVEQVLSNVMSNALKFTPSGGRVTIAVHHVGTTIEVAISDTGAGIAEADLGRIFDRFYRTPEALDDAVKGSGLGLSIAKGMIEAQRGAICVTSTPGVGSTFTVALPVCSPSTG